MVLLITCGDLVHHQQLNIMNGWRCLKARAAPGYTSFRSYTLTPFVLIYIYSTVHIDFA